MILFADLTVEEIHKLEDILSTTHDEGPEGEGWSSDTLSSLSGKISDAVRETKAKMLSQLQSELLIYANELGSRLGEDTSNAELNRLEKTIEDKLTFFKEVESL